MQSHDPPIINRFQNMKSPPAGRATAHFRPKLDNRRRAKQLRILHSADDLI